MSTSGAEPPMAAGDEEMMEGVAAGNNISADAGSNNNATPTAASAVNNAPHAAPNLEVGGSVEVFELDDSDSDDDSDGDYDTDEENEDAYIERYGTETCKGIIAPKIEGGRPFHKLTKSMQNRVRNGRMNFRHSRGAPPPGTPMYRGPPKSGIEPSALVCKEDRRAILLSSAPGPLYSLSALLKSPSVQAAVPKMLRDRAELGGLFRGRINITKEQATGGFAACSKLFTKVSAPPAVRLSSGKLCFDMGCDVMLQRLKSGFGGDISRYLDIISDCCDISMVLLVLGTDNEERWHMDRLIGMWAQGSIGRMFLTIGTTADGKQFGWTLKDPDGAGRRVYHQNEIMFSCPNGTFFFMDGIASGALWHDHLFGLMHAGRNGGGAGGIALDLTRFKSGKTKESLLAALGDAGFLDGNKGTDIIPGCIPIPKTEEMHPRAKAYGKAAEEKRKEKQQQQEEKRKERQRQQEEWRKETERLQEEKRKEKQRQREEKRKEKQRQQEEWRKETERLKEEKRKKKERQQEEEEKEEEEGQKEKQHGLSQTSVGPIMDSNVRVSEYVSNRRKRQKVTDAARHKKNVASGKQEVYNIASRDRKRAAKVLELLPEGKIHLLKPVLTRLSVLFPKGSGKKSSPSRIQIVIRECDLACERALAAGRLHDCPQGEQKSSKSPRIAPGGQDAPV